METEIEAKFIDIDPKKIRKKLKEIKAKKVYSEVLTRRKVFDYSDDRLDKIGGWIRVRDEGDKITLSYKQVNDRTLQGTKEITVEVKEFEKTCQFLLSIGLKQKSYQETKREKWILNDCEITIDTWPWIPPFVEIEGPQEKLVKTTAEELGFKWSMAIHGGVETVYQKHYKVTEKEINNWEQITFIPTPQWLENKRKNSQVDVHKK